MSRGELCAHLGLSLPTVANAVAELVEKGIATEDRMSPSTGGRKAQLVEIRADLGSVIGVSFTSRGITSARGDLQGKLSNIRHYDFSADKGNRTLALQRIEQAIADQLTSAHDGPAPCQVGLAVSGLIDREAGISFAFPRLEDWQDVPLVSMMEDRFGIPVALDNHIASTTLAELLFGANKGFNNALYVQLGPGLGMGIVVNGELYRGSGRNVGEFGHVAMREEGGPLCYCGNYGCLESLAGDYAIVQQAMAGLAEGVHTRLAELTDESGGRSIREVFRAAAEGDRFALNLVERAARLIGTGIANVTNLLAPDMIVLGGTMTGANDLLLDLIVTTLRTKALNRVEKDVQITTGSFGRHENITGAVAAALHHYFSQGMDKWKLS